jgi:hypothetical protein
LFFRRVHFEFIRDIKNVPPAAFKDPQNKISCDWNLYTDHQSSRALIAKEYKHSKDGIKRFKDSGEFFICKMLVKEIRELDFSVGPKHDPVQYLPQIKGLPNNRAHSIINVVIEADRDFQGKKDVRHRLQLSNIATWVTEIEKVEIDNLREQKS